MNSGTISNTEPATSAWNKEEGAATGNFCLYHEQRKDVHPVLHTTVISQQTILSGFI